MSKRKKLYKSFLLSKINFDDYSSDVRKVVLINTILFVSGFVLFFVAVSGIVTQEFGSLFILDIVGVAFVASIFVYLRITKNVTVASNVVTYMMFVLMLGVVYFGKGIHFSLIWTIFFPIFAIFLLGSRRGLVLSIIFNILVFILTYSGIGTWMNGAWDMESFLRYVVATLAMTTIVYFFEVSLDYAYSVLEEIRAKEEEYIQKLEKTSITDPLTQLYNRRYLDVKFKQIFHKAKKHGSVFALYIFDLDNFKLYNDTYGHIKGDEALQKISTVLKRDVFKRDTDSLFRLGGEEFCGLIVASDAKHIARSVENARKAIEELGIEHKKSPQKVLTASFGVCMIERYDREDFTKMYKLADLSLYKAKEAGRNQIAGLESISTL